MGIRVDVKKIRPDLDTLGFAVDLLMIGLIMVNLTLIVFDALYSTELVKTGLDWAVPSFSQFYGEQIHANFLSIDLVFVSIYITELLIRWAIAIYRNTYDSWFIYPFAHWYDVLGCIPVGSFRWLRVLRIVSLLLRLQRRGIIDLRETWIGALVMRYTNIVVEEVTDRVVIRVLTGVQEEIASGNQITQRIETQVLAPRKEELIDLVLQRIGQIGLATQQQWRAPLGQYLAHLAEETVPRTDAGKALNAMPVVGPRIVTLVGQAIEEVGLALTDQLVEDLNNPANRVHLDNLVDSIIEHAIGDRDELNRVTKSLLLDTLEEVKAEVAIKQWQQN